MNVAKLQKVVHREFTKSPLKTGFLVAMVPVALYFIVPLLWPGKPSKNKNKSSTKQIQIVQSRSQPAAQALVTQPPPPGRLGWQDLARGMDQDIFMRPGDWPPELRDPFEVNRQTTNDENEEPEESAPANAAPQIADRTPEELGISLTATMIGGRLRLATINGRTYRQNALIPLGAASGSSDEQELDETTGFRLLRIEQRSVVLRRNEKEYVLKIPRVRLTNGRALISRTLAP